MSVISVRGVFVFEVQSYRLLGVNNFMSKLLRLRTECWCEKTIWKASRKKKMLCLLNYTEKQIHFVEFGIFPWNLNLLDIFRF